jgi:hypothetical protein
MANNIKELLHSTCKIAQNSLMLKMSLSSYLTISDGTTEDVHVYYFQSHTVNLSNYGSVYSAKTVLILAKPSVCWLNLTLSSVTISFDCSFKAVKLWISGNTYV